MSSAEETNDVASGVNDDENEVGEGQSDNAHESESDDQESESDIEIITTQAQKEAHNQTVEVSNDQANDGENVTDDVRATKAQEDDVPELYTRPDDSEAGRESGKDDANTLHVDGQVDDNVVNSEQTEQSASKPDHMDTETNVAGTDDGKNDDIKQEEDVERIPNDSGSAAKLSNMAVDAQVSAAHMDTTMVDAPNTSDTTVYDSKANVTETQISDSTTTQTHTVKSEETASGALSATQTDAPQPPQVEVEGEAADKTDDTGVSQADSLIKPEPITTEPGDSLIKTEPETHTHTPVHTQTNSQSPQKSVQFAEEPAVNKTGDSTTAAAAISADPVDELPKDHTPDTTKAESEDAVVIPKKKHDDEDSNTAKATTNAEATDNEHCNDLVNNVRYNHRPSYQLFSTALNPDLYDSAKVDKSDKLERAQQRTMESEWDTDAWTSMVGEAQKGNVDTIRYYFGIFLSKFPMAARYWTLYIEKEIELSQFSRVEKCFQVLLPEIPNIELFKLYLKYMKDSKSTSPTFKETMKTAYRFSLDQIGLDMASTSVWQEYIDFLKGWDTATQYDASTKMMMLRETYQQAVVNPIQNVEGFWKEYDQYENGLNKLTARKLLQDKSAAYMTARAVLRDRRSRVDGINTQNLAVPLKGTAGEHQQLTLWKQYIAWEKTNPLKYDDRDVGVYKRVVLAYKQCLTVWYHCPEVWYEYCQFVAEGPPHDPGVSPPSATAEFSKACSALPTSQLLAFAFADYEEGKKNMAGATAAYERILADKHLTDPTLVYIQYMKYKRRSESTAAGRAVFKRSRGDKRTTSHLNYVASALMEYFSTKNEEIAVKIFKLGMKYHSTKVEYALSYLDFMLHLNESNNTRVLFERLLMMVPKEDQGPIWQRFLQFEADYGDLAAALSVEKRRREAMGMDAICHSIDRYHYLDLYPVEDTELERVGYHKLVPESTIEGVQSAVASDDIVPIKNSDFVVPDMKCLDHYNPEQGIVGPLTGPKSITVLLANLPPPMNFIGPYVDVEALIAGLSPPDVQESAQPGPEKPVEPTTTPASTDDAGKSGAGKRKKKNQGDSDDESPSTVRAHKGAVRRPVNIFNKRMRNTLAKDNQ